MANTPSAIDLSIPWATFIAQAKDDGTWSDIFVTLKADRVGFLVPATGIAVASGQLLHNGVDDFIKYLYTHHAGLKDYSLQTVGALTDDEVIATLAADGDLWRIEGVATGRTATDGEAASAKFSGHFYRDAGTVNILDPIHTIIETAPLAGIDIDLDINSNDVRVLATGIGGKTVDWAVRILLAEQIS